MAMPTLNHLLAWRIKVCFADRLGTREYLSNDIRHFDPGWGDETFNRAIERLEFYLPTGHKILLAGMEEYNFFVEAAQSLSNKAGPAIVAFWLLGKLPGPSVVECWRIGAGRIVRSRTTYGKEWGGTPSRGWKCGAVGPSPISTLVEV